MKKAPHHAQIGDKHIPIYPINDDKIKAPIVRINSSQNPASRGIKVLFVA